MTMTCEDTYSIQRILDTQKGNKMADVLLMLGATVLFAWFMYPHIY